MSHKTQSEKAQDNIAQVEGSGAAETLTSANTVPCGVAAPRSVRSNCSGETVVGDRRIRSVIPIVRDRIRSKRDCRSAESYRRGLISGVPKVSSPCSLSGNANCGAGYKAKRYEANSLSLRPAPL
jgi:hypothetical protein